ncbi:hypothetical protein JCM3774_002392 [Rhodotorula dairenensis]
MASNTAILSQGVGYAVVLGVGIAFTLLMISLTWIQTRYTKTKLTTVAEFASAGHSVKPALIGCAIVSSWTWAATLLQSSSMSYKVGFCGAYAYAAGATVQIVLFSMNAAKIKLNAPNARTYLEVIRTRWGNTAHIIFTFYAIATSLLVSSMLVTGGAAVVTDLTGANQYAISAILSLPVAGFVLSGGIRSSLLADFVHTTFLFIVILTFEFVVYATSDKIGSPSRMFDLLVQAGRDWPVQGNKDGSYLTFRSKTGMIFMIINLIGNFGTVFCDQGEWDILSVCEAAVDQTRSAAYWQRAIASRPSTAVKGFLLGGSAWLAVPLGMASAMGLSAVALKYDPSYPNYPIGLTASEVSAGLPAAAAAQTLLQASGASVLLVLLFLAVTSTTAAELCATSTIFANEIWLAYVRPEADEKEILRIGHIGIVGWALVMSATGCIFTAIGLSMGWLYEFMGIVIGAGVIPIALCIMWHKANRYTCMYGAVFGTSSGLVGWLVAAAKLNNGVVNLETTFQDYPMLIGNLLSFCLSGLIAVIGSLLWPEDYDWAETRALHAHPAGVIEESPNSSPLTEEDVKEKTDVVQTPISGRSVAPSLKETSMDSEIEPAVPMAEDSPENIVKTFRFARWTAICAFVILMILIPVPLACSGYISTKVGFTFYVVVTIIWTFYGFMAVCVGPLWEYRHTLTQISRHIWADLTRRKSIAK